MKPKIVFLCHFSSIFVRKHLRLKSHVFRHWLFKVLHRTGFQYHDFAIWVSDYIEEFKKNTDFEYHIVAPHKGMKHQIETFCEEGIHYHFYKCDGSLLYDALNAKFHWDEKNDFKHNRTLIAKIVNTISPQLVCLCGAENPYYSLGVLEVRDVPIYVILQTLLNDELRATYNVSSPYRREKELIVFSHAKYFSTASKKAIDVIRAVNNDAIILPSGFPTHRPRVLECDKQYDFMFFARSVSKNKGIEDYLKAVSIVSNYFPSVHCGVIGSCEASYRSRLDKIISDNKINDNVSFLGLFDSVDKAYTEVKKSKVLVLPSITAALNSTVREGMLMGQPVICYQNDAIDRINEHERCIITARYRDVEDLASKMKESLEHPEVTTQIGYNALDYSNHHFSNEVIVRKLLENSQLIIEKRI